MARKQPQGDPAAGRRSSRARAATSSPSSAATCATTSCRAASPSRPPTPASPRSSRPSRCAPQQQARTTEQAQEIARTLTTTILTIPVLAGAGDRLYGSVTPADIADEIWRTRKIRVDRRKVQLEEPDPRLGTYQVDIEVFPEVDRDGQDDGRARRGLDARPARSPRTTKPSSASRRSRRKERDSGAWRARSARDRTAKVPAVDGVGPVERAREGGCPPGACRRRTSTPSSRCSGRCCCPRPPSPRPPRCSRPRTSTAAGTARSSRRCSTSTSSSEPVDQVSVCDRLDQRGSLEQVGGRPAVFALTEAVPVVTNARRYADIVREMAHAARAHPRRHRGRAARLRPPGRHARAARHGRAEGLRDRAERDDARTSRSSSSRSTRPSTGSRCCSRTATAAASRASPTGFGELDRADVRAAEVEPRDPGRAAVDGQDEPRAQHRRARRRDAAEARSRCSRSRCPRPRSPSACCARSARSTRAALRRASSRTATGSRVTGADGDARQRAALHRRLGRDDGRWRCAPRRAACLRASPAGWRWSWSTTSS